MIKILILLAIIILIGLVIARLIYPLVYKWLKKDSFEIRKDMDDVDDNY